MKTIFFIIVLVASIGCKDETTNVYHTTSPTTENPADGNQGLEAVPSFRGDMDSGGGDQYAQEFSEIAYELVRTLKKAPILGVDQGEL